jgi:hypothetical protein
MPIKTTSKFINLPADFDPIDATMIEVQSWRRESPWTVHAKIRNGVYESYLDGRIRKIIFASVKRDRARTIAASQQQKLAKTAPAKRRPGRPAKSARRDDKRTALPDISNPNKAKIVAVHDDHSGAIVNHISPDETRKIIKRASP